MDTMLAGLCNVCDDFGHTNFDDLCSFVLELSSKYGNINPTELTKSIRSYQKFIKTNFCKLAAKHSPCIEFCLNYAFDVCSFEHTSRPTDVAPFYSVHCSLSNAIESLADNEPTAELNTRLDDMVKIHYDYIAHLLRTKHQGDYYKYVLKNLQPGECVMVIDYKMKLELGKRVREIQREWYGKRGISLHGCYVVAQISENERCSEVLDLWSDDTKQDAFFTQSALDICFGWLEKSFPGFSIYLFSGNYHIY
jgi:hypothetical protein